MTDYQGNSKRAKEQAKDEVPSKQIEKVVTGEVVVKKKPLRQKFKDLFIEADLKSVARYVTYEVMIPAARNLIVDTATKGIERLMYGESTAQRRISQQQATRYSYNNPIHRARETTMRYAPTPAPGPRSSRYSHDDYILPDRAEADLVLERMGDILEEYQKVSVADLLDLLGERSYHTDNKFGWVDLRGAGIRQIREGYLIDLPPAEPI